MFLCRAKLKKEGTWVVGQVVQIDDKWYMLLSPDVAPERPAYNSIGIGTGLEDQGITDRYEAAAYGWTQALERYEEQFPIWAEVDEKTIGRSSGFADLSGRVVFDGDIITANAGTPPFIPKYIIHPNEVTGVLSFKDENWKLKPVKDTIGIMTEFNVNMKGFLKSGVVIRGNIHDNPELIAHPEKL